MQMTGGHARVRSDSSSSLEHSEVEVEPSPNMELSPVDRAGGVHSSTVSGGGRRGGHARLETDEERLARATSRRQQWTSCASAFGGALVAVLVGFVALLVHERGNGDFGREEGPRVVPREVSRIAFGSCTSKGAQDDPGQPIWTQAIIPAEPDAWIWAGDMAYLDHPTVNCDLLPEDPDCVCRDNYMRVEPWCAAGDPQHGLRKFQTMIRNPEYNKFLDYMCPAARGLGMTPPPGTDSIMCPRSIIGTWDDHDFGWNDGDGRLEQKWVFKNMYLDAIGEQRDSPRRNAHQGMWHKHVYNLGTDREIEVFLLDERYDRTPKPCYVRQDYCDQILQAMDAGENATANTIWCADFLRGGHGDAGSCCPHDERIAFGWCLETSSRDSPYWEEACDSSSREFGKRWLVFDEGTGEVREPDGSEEVDSQDSPFCEVLGREQRAWLQRELDQSTASLRLIVSGSVVLGAPGASAHECSGEPCQCSGDDWDCYRPAQRNLLSQVSKAPGCSVIVTGDYHWGDIKAMLSGGETPYAEWYSSQDNSFPVYQIMASGMTTSTAIKGRECTGFMRDEAGLRTHPECDLVLDPNFGVLEVKFEEGSAGFSSLEMQIRDWSGAVRLTATLSPDQCNPRMSSSPNP